MRTRAVSDSRLRLEEVYRAHRERLWRSLFAFTGDRNVAEDALAETFAQALARGEEIERIDAWVWRTAFRVAAGQMKERESRPLPERDQAYYLPEPVDHLVRALRRLSPRQRLAVVLHDYGDRPTHEIAAHLGTSRATVYVHLSEGRRKLRRMLGDEDG
jgi:RNA polymerase sigma-70 factor (ECF subfamily)